MSERTEKFAKAARTFVTLHQVGVLSTHSTSQEGFPFGSLTPYDIDHQGNLYIYISLIAEHYRNLKADGRACLTVIDPFAEGDRQAFARVSALCTFSPVAEAEQTVVQASYEARFPDSINHAIAHNFLFMRGHVERVRWIGGFGDIGWVSRERFLAAGHDPISHAGYSAIEHMNTDHADALRDLASSHSAVAPTGDVRMISISSTELQLSFDSAKGRKTVEVAFPRPIAQAELRTAMIELVNSSREKSAKA